jgi:hypothetical protein
VSIIESQLRVAAELAKQSEQIYRAFATFPFVSAEASLRLAQGVDLASTHAALSRGVAMARSLHLADTSSAVEYLRAFQRSSTTLPMLPLWQPASAYSQITVLSRTWTQWSTPYLRMVNAWGGDLGWMLDRFISGPYHDYRTIRDPSTAESERLAAIDRLADHLARRWPLHDKQVKDALARRAQAEGTSIELVMRRQLATAIVLVLCQDIEQPQLIRSGDEWWTDADGHRAPVHPDDLPSRYAYRWADRRMYAVAEAALLDLSEDEYRMHRSNRTAVHRQTREGSAVRPGASTTLVSLDHLSHAAILECCSDENADPLYQLIEREALREEQAVQAALWQRMWARATPAQTRLLRAIFDQLQRGRSTSVHDAAATLGMNVNTAYAHLFRLRRALSA